MSDLPSLRRLRIASITAMLECPSCRREVEHEVHYVGGILHFTVCSWCQQRWEVQHLALEDAYIHRLPLRLASKPLRMGREAKRYPVRFARSLPRRFVTKPLRVAGELAEVIGWIGQ